ncbi:TM2 domain-containing protein [Pseudolysinimonas sp.]|uniref:TM2 domain-containing protein n=1 Tax=Pseudolysinimonas sp. TaxID=2680009 RepID=UPI003F7EABAD
MTNAYPPAAPPPPPQPGYPAAAGAISPKSRLVATLLSFFLGGLGIDRFYLGNIGMGVAKLLVGWLTLGIWPLVDFIFIVAGQAHDGQGLPVADWQTN